MPENNHGVLAVSQLYVRIIWNTHCRWNVLLAELVEEDLWIERAFPWLFHALEEEKQGGSQGLWAGQRYHQGTLEDVEKILKQITRF